MATTMQALAPLSCCAEICGLASSEMIIGARPRPEHEFLAASYFHGSSVVKATMRGAMVAAIRAALGAYQMRPAAELLVALRVMLAGEQVESSSETPRDEPAREGAVIVNLAERRVNLASNCALAKSASR